MNLYEILKQNEEHFMLEYYPITDLAYNYNLDKILKVKNEIVEFLESRQDNVDINYIIDYLVCYELNKYNKDRRYINNDYIKDFDKVFSLIGKSYNNGKIDEIFNFIDVNDVIETLSFDLKSIYYEMLKNNLSKVTKNILIKGLNNLYYYFIEDSKIWINLIIKYELTNEYFLYFDELVNNRLEEFLEYVCLLKDAKVNIDKYIEKFNNILDKCLESPDSEVLHSHLKYSTILAFYKKMKLAKANYYDKKLSEMKNKEDKWLEKNGHEIKMDLQLDKVIESIKKIDHPGMQIINYTHEQTDVDQKRKYLSFYEIAKRISTQNRPITLDLCATTQPHTQTYDVWLQECYTMIEILHLNILNYALFNNDLHEKYFQGLQVFGANIVKNYTERDTLYTQLQEILIKQEECIKDFKNKSKIKEFCKSTINFIEYLLRETYFELNKDSEYVDKDSLTLGAMLDWNKGLFKPLFNEDFVNGLRYYLSHDRDNKNQKVGLDLRNKMSHSNNLIDNDYDQTLFIRVSLIFTTLINEMYLICLKTD